jgi:hypothetical protein
MGVMTALRRRTIEDMRSATVTADTTPLRTCGREIRSVSQPVTRPSGADGDCATVGPNFTRIIP